MDILEPYVGFVPGVLVTVVLTVGLGRGVGVLLAAGPVLGSGLMLAIGVVLSATVTPGQDALSNGSAAPGSCDLTRFGLPTWNQLTVASDVALNVLLFVPLGLAVGLLPASPARRPAVLLAYALPVAIEAVQFALPPLGRACQGGDIVDNVTGLTVGILAAVVASWFVALQSRPATRPVRRSHPSSPAAAAGIATVLLIALTLLTSSPPAGARPTANPSQTTAPTATPVSGESVRIDSVNALLEALAEPGLREIVVANGTYRVSPAGLKAPDSLWIGSSFATRTRPIIVRADTPGGVTFDGAGASGFGGIWFADGAHHQTWDGFVFANGAATSTGAIMFGEGDGVAPHHITLRNITITASVTGRSTSASAPANDHAIYVSQATEGPHDLLFEDITVDGTGGLASAFHFYHSDATHRNAWNVTVRRLNVRGTQQAIMLWDDTLRDITFDTADIVDALSFAVRYEAPGASGIVLANMTSTGSGSGKGFHSSLGANPPGVTFDNVSFR